MGWGWWPWLLGRLDWDHAWEGMAGMGVGVVGPGPKDKARQGQAGNTVGARCGCQTQQWELAGAQVPSPGKERRMTPGEAMPRPSRGRKSKGSKDITTP